MKTEDGAGEVTHFSSNSAGYFHVPLAPGTYLLESANQAPPSWPLFRPLNVTVESNKFTIITLMFDTGIR